MHHSPSAVQLTAENHLDGSFNVPACPSQSSNVFLRIPQALDGQLNPCKIPFVVAMGLVSSP
jgi:hypothetical protein